MAARRFRSQKAPITSGLRWNLASGVSKRPENNVGNGDLEPHRDFVITAK